MQLAKASGSTGLKKETAIQLDRMQVKWLHGNL